MKKAMLLLPLLLSSTVHAERLWSDASLSYLQGSDYEAGDPDRQVYTLELATGHSWGDSFSFVDRLLSKNGDRETYFEIGLRYKLEKLIGKKMQYGVISDISLAAQWESLAIVTGGFANAFDHYLYGVSLDWKILGFKYFKSTFYYRNRETGDNNEQLTLAWALPFNVGSANFVFDGFMDYSTNIGGDSKNSMNFTPQLKYDLGDGIGIGEKQLYLGVEYVYWQNKFNVDSFDESNPNFLLKWHF